jgi:hypothetical protein
MKNAISQKTQDISGKMTKDHKRIFGCLKNMANQKENIENCSTVPASSGKKEDYLRVSQEMAAIDGKTSSGTIFMPSQILTPV